MFKKKKDKKKDQLTEDEYKRLGIIFKNCLFTIIVEHIFLNDHS